MIYYYFDIRFLGNLREREHEYIHVFIWICILLVETNNIQVYLILTGFFFILFYGLLGSSVVQEMALQGSGIFTDLRGNIFWLMSANDFLGKVMVFNKVKHKDSMYNHYHILVCLCFNAVPFHLRIFYSVYIL